MLTSVWVEQLLESFVPQ